MNERIPPTGLCNNSCQGCYVNSSIQLLNCIPSFIDYFNTITEENDELLYRLKVLFVDYDTINDWSTRNYIYCAHSFIAFWR